MWSRCRRTTDGSTLDVSYPAGIIDSLKPKWENQNVINQNPALTFLDKKYGFEYRGK